MGPRPDCISGRLCIHTLREASLPPPSAHTSAPASVEVAAICLLPVLFPTRSYLNSSTTQPTLRPCRCSIEMGPCDPGQTSCLVEESPFHWWLRPACRTGIRYGSMGGNWKCCGSPRFRSFFHALNRWSQGKGLARYDVSPTDCVQSRVFSITIWWQLRVDRIGWYHSGTRNGDGSRYETKTGAFVICRYEGT